MDTAPLIVSALFGPEDFAWLDGLRRRHFPPARNVLSAHLTMFHHLPPSIESELRGRLAEAARASSPAAQAAGLINLGRGVAVRMNSPGLNAIRGELAEAFEGVLTPQDRAGWRAHVTIQNKVASDVARRLLAELGETFSPREVRIAGLGLWRYQGGRWETAGTYMFRG